MSRPVTQDEAALFRHVFGDAKPLGTRRQAANTHKYKRPVAAAPSALPVKAPALTGKKASPSLPCKVGGHREMQLRRGRLEPQARIDLHGMTQDNAYRALVRFFARAHSLDQRLVLVITGKGGVLRQIVPRWLGEYELRPFITGVSPAHIRHGGDGALYVALRRRDGKTVRGR